MIGYMDHIEELTRANTYFRRVLYTGLHHQLVLMALLPSEEIGMETHSDNDQFFRFEEGEGKVVIGGEEHLVKDHPDGTIHKTKAEAMEAEAHE